MDIIKYTYFYCLLLFVIIIETPNLLIKSVLVRFIKESVRNKFISWLIDHCAIVVAKGRLFARMALCFGVFLCLILEYAHPLTVPYSDLDLNLLFSPFFLIYMGPDVSSHAHAGYVCLIQIHMQYKCV